MLSKVTFEQKDLVGVITINNPPVNALDVKVRQQLLDALEAGLVDSQIQALVLTGEGRIFSAGMDLHEFGHPIAPPELDDIISKLETSPKLIVSALNGAAIGGGFELALGCDYRIGSSAAKVSFPEVHLGLMPGAGGTQRLPRLVSVNVAVELITSGSNILAEDALRLGILDQLIDGDLLEGSLEFVHRCLTENEPRRRLCNSDLVGMPGQVTQHWLAQYCKNLGKVSIPNQENEFAVLKCVEAIESAIHLSFQEGLKRERELFNQCLNSTQTQSKIHLFLSKRKTLRIPGSAVSSNTRAIQKVSVVGSGVMGRGIAMAFANTGVPIKLLATCRVSLEHSLKAIAHSYESAVSKDRLSWADSKHRLSLITGAVNDSDIGDSDLVIEAVTEDMRIKQHVFAQLDNVCHPTTIFATNTSSLDINMLANATKRQQYFIGMHFFNPAHKMQLLEIISASQTRAEVISSIKQLAKRLGKIGILVGNCQGFAANRMLNAYLFHAESLLGEGALPGQIDQVLEDFGMSIGPFAMSDMVGLDIILKSQRHRNFLQNQKRLPTHFVGYLCRLGRLGQKTGAGWYRYEPGSYLPIPDPQIGDWLKSRASSLGCGRHEFGNDEILKKCLYSLINEGMKILEAGIVQEPSDIDLISVYGYGFPANRGGLMFYAEAIGFPNIYGDISKFRDADPVGWQPSQLLRRLAESGESLYRR